MTPPSELLARLRSLLGAAGYLDDAQAMARYTHDERGLFSGRTAAVLRPDSTESLAEAMRLCHAAGVAIVPQGGNTGYCGGSVPDTSGDQVLVSLSRMNRVRHIDPLNYTMVVEAGCVLADLQQAAEAVDRLFPLSLGAEGSCQIGGNLSTNAGGVAVLKFGNAGDLVLGLEVVLP
ncbi:MAG: FAD-binding oxidoreductase, partial [Gammaproteobacteria bacterium]|nr:FAD-binding oxidoreductase [Gammaproteobacteria bacterium]